MKIYTDNIESSANVYDSLSNPVSNSHNFYFAIREDLLSHIGDYWWDGELDEVVIYDKELNSTEVAFRYNTGTGTEQMISGVSPYGWWHLNEKDTTKGYIQSIPLTSDGSAWLSYSADYDLKDGNIQFSVLDQNNNTLCSGLGDISSCAGSTSPIKLFANITKPLLTDISPEMERWFIFWEESSVEEIRGAGEIHISNNISHINQTYFDEQFNQTHGNQQVIYNFLQSMNTNISIDMVNKATYIENLIIDLRNNMTWNFNNTNYNITTFRNEAYTWYVDIQNRIYQCCQKWLEDINDLLPSGQLMDALVSGGRGATQTECGLLDRVLGRQCGTP